MMRVAQRTDHVVRALVRLAQGSERDHVPAGEIARAVELPRRQIEQEFGRLSKAGILECRRGASGGCRLARPADEVTLKALLEALDGDVLDIPAGPVSATSGLWGDLRSLVERHLDATTLAELASAQDALDEDSTPMYYI